MYKRQAVRGGLRASLPGQALVERPRADRICDRRTQANRSRDVYKRQLHILPWIYTVAIRCIGQIYLKRKLICADYVDINSIPPSKLYSDEEILEGNYELLSPDMAVAVEMLKPAQKEAIILKVQGYTIPEIAKILYANRFIKTSNNNTVKRVLFTARSKLSKLVDRDGKLLVPLPQESEKPRSAKMPSLDNDNTDVYKRQIRTFY